MMNKAETASFETPDGTEQNDDVTRPIGVGAFASAEANGLPGETGKMSLKLRSSSIVLAAVVILAMVGLFSMRTLAKVTAVVSGSDDMERLIEDFLNSSAGRSVYQFTAPTGDVVNQSNEVLAVLNEAYTERQVSLTDVQKDPFLILGERQDQTKATTTSDTKPNDIERQRAERREQLSNLANRLSLKSVMLGSVPLANINGQIVRPGEIITIMPEHQEFEVLSIEGDTVRLATSDLTLNVRIEVEIGINRDQKSGRKR